MRKQISPVQQQNSDYEDANNFRFCSFPICQPQARRTCYENGKSVDIKQRDRTQTCEDERIENQRVMEMSVKELNSRSRCAARYAGESG